MRAQAAAKSQQDRMAEWLEDRRRGITSGDVSDLLGLDRRSGPMDVWLEKRGLSAGQRFQNERMKWGLRLQRAILEGYADRVNRPIEHADPYTFVRCPSLPLLGATLDARCTDGDRRPVDAKNIGFKRLEEWGPDGSDLVPYGYVIQLHVQMMATETDVADLAVLFGGHHLEVFTIRRDADLCRIIGDVAQGFWRDHVLTGIPPPPDASEGWRRFLQTIPQRRPDVLVADPATEELLQRLVEIRDEKESLEETEASLENRIKAYIGEAAGVAFGAGRVTWKQATDSRETDWERVAEALARRWSVEEWAAIVNQHTRAKPGSRRFLLSLHKEALK